MVNKKHLQILRQGAAAWNEWRLSQPKGSPRPDLIGADLSGADLPYVDFSFAKLFDAQLTRANLSKANLHGADLRESELYRATLTGANLQRATLEGAQFERANLDEVNLFLAGVKGVSFAGASLVGASFSGARLYYVDFTGAKLSGANFGGAVVGSCIFSRINLRGVDGLDDVDHLGPSEVSISTIFESGGEIPERFLRGCGVPDDFITYMRSLAIRPIQFYSCFISYSSKDQEFTDRLYADLQNKGVRCWFAPEDLKIGDRFRDRIDESIRLHDKLLLILSENSVSSPWVNDEVEAAIEREHREGKMVLFPIRVDDAVMDSDKAWAATIRRTRHVGDFTRWKDHDSYSKEFERLLRDLEAVA